MIRIVFLMGLFIYNIWGMYRCIKLWLDPSDGIKSIEAMDSKEARIAGVFTTIVTGVVYITVFALNALIVPRYSLTVALLVAAAIELILIFTRLSRIGEMFDGNDTVKNWLRELKSPWRVISFIWNIVETGIVGVSIYYILWGLA